MEVRDNIKHVESGLDDLKVKASEIEQELLKEFERDGMASMSIDGRTVYLRRDLRANAKAGQREAVCRALKANGVGDLVSEGFHAGQLSAWVRELEKLEEPLPEQLDELLNVNEMFSVRIRN